MEKNTGKIIKQIPKEILNVNMALSKAGFESYLVGGCVRDLLLGQTPKDWDLTTNAKPDEIQAVFHDSFYENDYGTVGVKTRSEDDSLKVVEITPYRLELGYTDSRHPDKVVFSDNIKDDLARRDFTINALALDISKGHIIDEYKGQEDLKRGLIRAVGDPNERFGEDALRIMRAIRFAAQLNFSIEAQTQEAIEKNKDLLGNVSRERVGDEFKKLIITKNPIIGLFMAEKLHILSHIVPIFEETVGVEQNKEAHKYDVWEHSLRALQHAADKNLSLEVRLAALFHDVSKPYTKREVGGGSTFYGHEVVGARVTRETLQNLHFSREIVSKVQKLVRYHMFFADTEQITHSAVRRLVAKVGKDNIWDLMSVRMCDRIGSGRPKEQPYRLRKYQSMVEEVIRDPLSVGMLKTNGDLIMKTFHVEPGPKIGWILNALLEEILEDPSLNNETFLMKHTEKLLGLPKKELKDLGEQGRKVLEDAEGEEIEKIRSKRHVK